jgi:hypothetical protein
MFISKYRGSSYEDLPAGAWALYSESTFRLEPGSWIWVAAREHGRRDSTMPLTMSPLATSIQRLLRPGGSKMPNERFEFPYHQSEFEIRTLAEG